MLLFLSKIMPGQKKQSPIFTFVCHALFANGNRRITFIKAVHFVTEKHAFNTLHTLLLDVTNVKNKIEARVNKTFEILSLEFQLKSIDINLIIYSINYYYLTINKSAYCIELKRY